MNFMLHGVSALELHNHVSSARAAVSSCSHVLPCLLSAGTRQMAAVSQETFVRGNESQSEATSV
jgi:hypothetical protein